MNRTGSWIAAGVLALTAALAGVLAAGYEPERPLAELAPAYTNAESEWVEVAGTRVHYRVEGTGPTLVLVHGTSSSLHTWEGWARRLSDGYRVVRMDLPGFGLTGPRPDGDYTIGSYVAFLKDFAQALDLDRFHLAGNSLGGLIAWRYALAHPGDVGRLILVDPAGHPHKGFSMLLAFGQIPGLNLIMQRITPEWVVRGQVENVYGDPDRIEPGTVKRYHELMLREGNRKAFVEYTQTADFDRHYDRIGEITAPALVMWGDRDRLIPVDYAPAFVRDMPNAELKIYPGVGHVPMEEVPAATAADARDFLAAAATAATSAPTPATTSP